jgi:hypothetical protein
VADQDAGADVGWIFDAPDIEWCGAGKFDDQVLLDQSVEACPAECGDGLRIVPIRHAQIGDGEALKHRDICREFIGDNPVLATGDETRRALRRSGHRDWISSVSKPAAIGRPQSWWRRARFRCVARRSGLKTIAVVSFNPLPEPGTSVTTAAAHLLMAGDGSPVRWQGAGDSNGDGFDDVIIVATGGDYSGDGLDDFIVRIDDGEYIFLFVRGEANPTVGETDFEDAAKALVTMAPKLAMYPGDLDGDGLEDVIVSNGDLYFLSAADIPTTGSFDIEELATHFPSWHDPCGSTSGTDVLPIG